ncbi:MAG TPA: hypothetical protein VGE45_10785 [Chloroflexia bacterium]|jgi:hypothetical protein
MSDPKEERLFRLEFAREAIVYVLEDLVKDYDELSVEMDDVNLAEQDRERLSIAFDEVVKVVEEVYRELDIDLTNIGPYLPPRPRPRPRPRPKAPKIRDYQGMLTGLDSLRDIVAEAKINMFKQRMTESDLYRLHLTTGWLIGNMQLTTHQLGIGPVIPPKPGLGGIQGDDPDVAIDPMEGPIGG